MLGLLLLLLSPCAPTAPPAESKRRFRQYCTRPDIVEVAQKIASSFAEHVFVGSADCASWVGTTNAFLVNEKPVARFRGPGIPLILGTWDIQRPTLSRRTDVRAI